MQISNRNYFDYIDNDIRLNKNIFIFSEQGNNLLFDSLIPRFYQVSSYIVKILDFLKLPKNLKDVLIHFEHLNPEKLVENIENLVKLGLLSREKESSSTILNPIQTKPDIRTMFIIPTKRCNFHCFYCHFINNKKVEDYEDVNEYLLLNYLDYFEELSKDAPKRNIVFFGGEPLLKFESIRKTFKYFQNSGKEVPEYSIFTNCSLVTKDIARDLSRWNFKIIASIDGPENIHNMMRVYYDGSSTYADAIRGYNLLREKGCEVGISCTVGLHNVEALDEICTYLIDKLHPSNLGFNILHELLHFKNPAYVDLKQVNLMMLKAYQICMDKGVYFVQAINRLRPIVEERARLQDCGAYGKQIVVTPDNMVGPCEVFSSCNRYFEKFSKQYDIRKSPLFLEWANRYPSNFQGCKRCMAIALCGGGCAYDSIIHSGSINHPDERCCEQAFTFLEWSVKSIMRKIDNLDVNDELFIEKIPPDILLSLYGNINVYSEKYPLTNYHKSLNVSICNRS